MKLWFRSALIVAVVLLSACAASGGKSGEADTQAVLERAVERWNLLISIRPDKAWEYLSPGYRETHPLNTYATEMSRRPVRWFKVEPYGSVSDAVECDESGLRCDVRVVVYFKIHSHLTSVGMIESSQVLKESWIKLKGQWYHVPNDVVR